MVKKIMMKEQIELLEKNLDIVSRELVDLKTVIATALTKLVSNIDLVDKKIGVLDKKINELNFKIENLDVNTATGLNEVGTKIESLTEEISKIGSVTGYDQMYKNQKDIS